MTASLGQFGIWLTALTPCDALPLIVVLCVAASVAVAPLAIRELVRRPASGRDANHRGVRLAMIAATSGVSAIVGATLAHAAVGPQALPWLWLSTVVAAGALALEAVVIVRARGRNAKAQTRAPQNLGEVLAAGSDRAGTIIAWVHGLVAALAVVVGFALLIQAEAGEAIATLTGSRSSAVGIVVAALAVPLVFVPRRSGRSTFLSLVPLFVLAWVGLCLIVIASDPSASLDTLAAAVGIERGIYDASTVRAPVSSSNAALAGLLVPAAISVGLSRGLLVAQPGLGLVAGLASLDRARRPGSAALAVVAAPLLGGLLVSTFTVLALGAAQAPQQRRIDERTVPSEYAHLDVSPDAISPRVIHPGPAHGRGLEPHLTYGQMIVLPEDTPFEHKRRYPMVFKADPRGVRAGEVDAGRNLIALPAWQVAEGVDTVVFRPRDPKQAQHVGFDVRIPVERKVALTWRKEDLDKPEAEREDVPVIELRPVDSTVRFGALVKEMDGPYLVLDDFHFVGTVLKAMNEGYGQFLAMYEDREPLAPENPVLRSIITMGYRGPYYDTDPHAEVTPNVLAAEPGFVAPVGTVLELRMSSPPRGMSTLPFGPVLRDHNKEGELRTPAWDFLANVKHARLRHREDPTQDLLVPVDHRLAEDGSLRFWSSDPDLVQFRHAKKMKLFDENIALEVPDYVFEVEVRGGARLPSSLRDRQTLVPIDPRPAPTGAHRGLYRPHPIEVFAADMSGPWLAQRRGAWLGASVRAATGDLTTLNFFAALLLVLLSVAGLSVVASAGGRALEGMLGRGASIGFEIVCLTAAAVAPTLAGDDLVRMGVGMVAIAAPIGVLATLIAHRRRA